MCLSMVSLAQTASDRELIYHIPPPNPRNPVPAFIHTQFMPWGESIYFMLSADDPFDNRTMTNPQSAWYEYNYVEQTLNETEIPPFITEESPSDELHIRQLDNGYFDVTTLSPDERYLLYPQEDTYWLLDNETQITHDLQVPVSPNTQIPSLLQVYWEDDGFYFQALRAGFSDGYLPWTRWVSYEDFSVSLLDETMPDSSIVAYQSPEAMLIYGVDYGLIDYHLLYEGEVIPLEPGTEAAGVWLSPDHIRLLTASGVVDYHDGVAEPVLELESRFLRNLAAAEFSTDGCYLFILDSAAPELNGEQGIFQYDLCNE